MLSALCIEDCLLGLHIEGVGNMAAHCETHILVRKAILPVGLAGCSLFLVLLLTSLWQCVLAEGNGSVVALANRGGFVQGKDGVPLESGIRAILDDGTEVNILPVKGSVAVGDKILKRKWSVFYLVNGSCYNGFVLCIVGSLNTCLTALAVLICVIPVLLILNRARVEKGT